MTQTKIENFFYDNILKADLKYTKEELEDIKQGLSAIKVEKALLNPFTTLYLPKYVDRQLPAIILLMTKQIEELSLAYLNFNFFQKFVKIYSKELSENLKNNNYLCDMFCRMINRYLQIVVEFKQKNDHLKAIKNSQIVDFLLSIIDLEAAIQSSTIVASENSEAQFSESLFLSILWYASVCFTDQSNFKDEKYRGSIQKMVQISIVMMQYVQKGDKYQLLRQFVNYTSHLLIFNEEEAKKPESLFRFSRDQHKIIIENHIKPVQINLNIQKQYYSKLALFLQKDTKYINYLLRMTKNLLEAHIKNDVFRSHFQNIVTAIRTQPYLHLKVEVYKMLMANENQSMSSFIDCIFQDLLSQDPLLPTEQTQSLNRQLAQKGQKYRKYKFLDKYQKLQHKIDYSLTFQSVNFIIKTYFEESLNLNEFQAFIQKQCALFRISTFIFIHKLIGRLKSQHTYQLFDVFVKQRIKIWMTNYARSNVIQKLVDQQCLQASKDNEKAYQIYLKNILQKVSQNTLQAKIGSNKIKFGLIKLQPKHLRQFVEPYCIILKKALSNKIDQQHVLVHLIYLQVIFGKQLDVSYYQYFTSALLKMKEEQKIIQILQLLKRLVKLFMNSASVLLYLQAVLAFQQSQPHFIQKKLYNLQFLVNLLSESTFFKVQSYSLESITILIELSTRIQDQKLQAQCLSILKVWSLAMTEIECNNLCYLFCYRQIKKNFPFMSQKRLKMKQCRIQKLWGLIIQLLDYRNHLSEEYLKFGENKLILVGNWKKDENIDLEIGCQVLRNRSFQMKWDLFIITTSTKVYNIYMKNQQLYLYENNKQDSDKQIVQNLILQQQVNYKENFAISLKLQKVNESKAIIRFQIQDKFLQVKMLGNIQKIQSKCYSPLLLKNLVIRNHLVGLELKEIKSHLEYFLNSEVKIRALDYISIKKFNQKVDFQLLYGLLGQKLKVFRHFDAQEAFSLLIKVSCKLFDFLLPSAPHITVPREIDLMKAIFKLVLEGFSRNKLSIFIDFRLEIPSLLEYSYYLYHLYISALLPYHFWKFFTPQTQIHLTQTLLKYLQIAEFKQLENDSIELFSILTHLVPHHQQKLNIMHQIILKHELNQYLAIKFQHYILHIGRLYIIKPKITDFIGELIDYMESDLRQHAEKKQIMKFLIFSANMLEMILPHCSKDKKISLIHYMFYHQVDFKHKNSKESLSQLILNSMQKDQRTELVVLLLIELQQDSLPKQKKLKLSFSRSKKTLQKSRLKKQQNPLYLNLYLMVKLWQDIDSQTIQDTIINVQRFLSIRFQQRNQRGPIQVQTQNTICTQQYVKFLYFIRSQTKKQSNFKQRLDKIYELSLCIILQSQKQKFSKFMHHYLEYAVNNLQFSLLPFKLERLSTFKIYHHNVVLQYIYSIFVKMKYTGCSFDHQKAADQFSAAAISYIQYLTMNSQVCKQVSQPLLYAFPYLAIYKKIDNDIAIQMVQKVKKQQYHEIRGGLYFKIMLIILELIQNCIEIDFSTIVELLILFKENTSKSTLSFMRINKEKVIKQPKIQRQVMIKQLQLVEKQHLKYYKEIQKGTIQLDQKQINLSYYLIDYFVMRLCEYLKNYSQDLQQKTLVSYSALVLKYFKSLKAEQDKSTIIEVLKYEDLLYLSNSKKVNKSMKQNQNSNKRRFHIQQLVNQLSKIQKAFDPRFLCNFFRDMNISLCFGLRQKQIRFLQFLDIHNILNRSVNSINPNRNEIMNTKFQVKSEMMLEQHHKKLKKYKKKCQYKDLDFVLKKIKKIYPYTCANRTVLRIKEINFDNMACPITQYVGCKKYQLKKLRHLQSSNMIYFQQNIIDDESSEATQKMILEQLIATTDSQENYLVDSLRQIRKGNQFCEVVTRQGVYFCQWHFSVQNLRLQPLKNRPNSLQIGYMKKGAHEMCLITKDLCTMHIGYNEIQQILLRKYCHNFNSIQIFLKNGTSKFINLYEKNLLYAFLKIFEKVAIGIKIITQPVQQFHDKKYTQKWIDGIISNFDYLMVLNKYSGRTYNDLNQYYIFPWVLTDYHSKHIDLSNPNAFRDLSKPIGAINPQKLQRFKFFYKNNNKQHYYGSHYSTSLFILYYLVRLEPFSSLHWQIQKGNFDLPDRLFVSIQDVWESLISPSCISDIKQLIPQFYYLPTFLKNVGNIEFGQKMCGEDVSDILLPPWAQTPEEFIITLRAALQSDWVSKNLQYWIDLVFGVHQCSQKKYNKFLQTSYQQKAQQLWNKGNIEEGVIHQIMYFGQCPSKLFTTEHRPKRLITEAILQKPIGRLQIQSSIVSSNIFQIKPELKIINISQNAYKFKIEVQKQNKKVLLQTEVDLNCDLEDIKHSLKYLVSKNKSKIGNFQPTKKKFIQFHKTGIKIGKETVLQFQMNYAFQHAQINQMWIVYYGLHGLRVYNWQQTLYWKWQKEQVCKVFIESNRIIFGTPSGKLCFYSFFNRNLQEVQIMTDCFNMEMEVYCLPRVPSLKQNKNEIQYRILCSFDNKKLGLFSYTFKQVFNYSSSKQKV